MNGEIWQFLGTAPENANPWVQVAYYGVASDSGPGSRLLKIRMTDGAVTLTDCTAHTAATGTYSLTTHLFQTDPGQLPMPMYGAEGSDGNYVRWEWLAPPSGRPATVLVGGDVWGYTGSDPDGTAHYAGYYTGQQISLVTNGRDGFGSVTLNDPLHPFASWDNAWHGTVYNNSFQFYDSGHQLIDWAPVVYSGDNKGTTINPGLSLATTMADLDVVGNLFSLGTLVSDGMSVGFTLGFSDDGTKVRLTSVLSRPQAEWLWCNATPGNFGTPGNVVTMMKLGKGNALTLFDPLDPANAGIVLSPFGQTIIGPYPDSSLDAASGTDRTKGVFVVAAGKKDTANVITPRNALRVLEDGTVLIQPGGDIGMGEFTAGPQP